MLITILIVIVLLQTICITWLAKALTKSNFVTKANISPELARMISTPGKIINPEDPLDSIQI